MILCTKFQAVKNLEGKGQILLRSPQNITIDMATLRTIHLTNQ